MDIDFLEQVFANIEGHTLFSLILSRKKYKLLEKVYKSLKNEKEILTEIPNRRLFLNLTRPFINCCEI